MDSSLDIQFSETQTEWVKFGTIKNIAFVGRETICVGDGCHLVFYNLNTKTEKIYTAGNDTDGMGVSCIAGHRTYSICLNNKVNSDYKLEMVIKCEFPGDKPTYFSWFKAGLAVACPNGAIMHFKKSGNWCCDWQVTPKITVIRLLNSPRDFLVGVTERGDIVVYNNQTQEFSFVKQYEILFRGLCLIYPVGEIIVTLAWYKTLTAWEVSTGTPIDSIDCPENALSIVSNPEYPYIAVGCVSGIVRLYSLYDGKKIQLLTSFLLTRNAISHVSFAESGKLLVAANMDVGEFFIIEGVPGTKMNVVATCCAKRQIADYILVGSKTCLRLFVLNVTSDMYIAGNIISRFCIIRAKECPDVKDYIFEDANALYSKLYATDKPNRDRVFYAMPVRSKCLHELEVKRGDDFARLIGRIPTKHQMRKIIHHFDHQHIVSYGYDGLIIIADLNFETKHIIMPHHRFDAGVETAFVVPTGKYVISLGRNNLLTCSNIAQVEVDEEKLETLRKILTSPRLILMFKHPTTGFLPIGEFEGVTWLEMEEMKRVQEDYLKCATQRKSIIKHFKSIKKQVVALLTQNLEGPENEYLDIQDFNLDSELKEQRWLENNLKCKETKIHLEKMIVAQDKVSDWIKQYCWDTMAEQGKTIFGIFADIDVDNYVLLPEDVNNTEVSKYIEEHRVLEEMMANVEIFEPWVPRTPSQMKTFMEIKPTFVEVAQEKVYLDDAAEDEPDMMSKRDVTAVDAETLTAFAGSITHTFVELSKGHYTQHQIQTFLQTEYQSVLSKVENIKLRLFFNKEFESLMSIKIRQINDLSDRNARLRHIISELNYFSEEKMNILVMDAEWKQQEYPEQILQVKDDEVTVTPYISPSQQAILDAEAAERERIRLLLLADDFKERALMVMMNGVLEVRWEDELRKDVPVPKCMIEKQPEDYVEDDLRAIRSYEEKVKFLESERLRYRKMLVAEYGTLGNTVRENVKKFNSRVEELLLLKIKVDSAIAQENMKINRLRLRNFRRIEMSKVEREIQKAIAANDKKIDELTKLITGLYDDSNECRSFLEGLQGKEKIIEKTYRKDMQDASPTAQEIAQRLYKRRPKTNIRSITSPSMLVELAKCVATKEKSVILNQDALDFLRAMDTLDLYVGVPNAVDEHTYAIICKNRRFKVESELKIKAAQMEATEGDNTISYLHKVLLHLKENSQKLSLDLAQIRSEKIKEAQDIEIQVVLKQGFVEIPTSGELSDFENAVMLSRKDIEAINLVILEAGNRKLKAMRDTMNFRRGILAMEWEHAKMKMQIDDLEDYLNDIRAIKVTKEIQTYMKARARGESPDKGLTFEQEVDLVRQSYQRLIDAKKADCIDVQEKIDGVKQSNKTLDKAIVNLNVDVCEFRLGVDKEVIRKEKELINTRMNTLITRSRLVKQIQANHNQILMLQTELELLRLKTYPTLKYKICE
ncbi:hypothetical protein MML48_6g00013951 [Holotrichia oblita]|uniref:Uncharacterized protein n=1 Tax=Holotrichia oblita TaxID=644536 RepID=A0ACB9SX26_HOLOL|nr:hypothetical protein MML48_6g00013951 [Holotrichia oblita]